MAQAYVNTLQGKYSDIVLGRVVAFGDTGWNFKELDLAFDATVHKAGLVVTSDGTPVASAAEADSAYGVLVDRKTLPGVDVTRNGALVPAGQTVPLVIIVRGATLNKLALFTGDGLAITDAVAVKLEDRGFQVTDYIVGTVFLGDE